MPTGKHIRIGIVGAGSIVESAHLPVLSARSDVEISWILDRDHERARDVGKAFGVSAVLEPDYSRVDLLLLAIPLGSRDRFLTAARDARLAVYCEKPAARTRLEHRALVDGFPPHACSIGYQRRFHPQVEVLRSLVASGCFGRLLRCDLRACHFNLRSGGSDHFSQDTSQSGGGITIESAIHSIDLALWIQGATSVEVRERRTFAVGRLDYEMRFELLLGAGNAFPSSLHGEVSTLRNEPSNGLLLSFERATVSWDLDPAADVLLLGGPAPLAIGRTRGTVLGAFVRCWSATIAALRTASPNRSSACTSDVTSAAIELLYAGLAPMEQEAM